MADESGTNAGKDLTLEPVASTRSGDSRGLWIVLVVLALVVGAVVATTGGQDAPPRLPLALGATSGESRASSADAMLVAPVTYVAGQGLPALGGEAPAYRLEGKVDVARVRAIARALGLTGDPVHEERLWRVTDADAILEVHEGGGGAWWYSPSGGVVSSGGGSSSGGSGSSGCAPGPDGSCLPPEPTRVDPTTTFVVPADCPPDADCVSPACPPGEYCTMPVEPTPPADLPTKTEAQKIALDLLATTGVDLADAKVSVEGPYEAWYVTVEPKVDGRIVSGWLSSVSVGSKGVITSASGTLGTPVRLGSYPLLDTRAAIDRLNSYGGYGGGPIPLGAPDGVARDLAVTSEPSVTDQSDGCAPQPDGSELCHTIGTAVSPPDCGAPVPMPVSPPGSDDSVTTVGPEQQCPEPVPYEPPTPIEIELTDAEQILMVQYAIDGSEDAYLVPGYRFSGTEGYAPEVVAIVDDSLAPTTIPSVTKPTGESPVPVEPQPGAVEPSGGTGTPAQEAPTAKP